MTHSWRSKELFKLVAAFAAIYTIWGTTYLGIRIAVDTIPPFFMAAARFLIAGSVTFLLLRVRGRPLPNRVHWRSAVIIGAFLLVGGNGLVTWSEQQIPSSTAALVVATVPLWIALFDWLLFRGARPGKQVTMGLLLGFGGIALLLGPGQILGTTDFSLSALLILLLAPVLWSLGSLYVRQAPLPEDIFMTTAMEMLAGGFLLLLAGLLTGEAARLNLASISAASLIALLYLTLFGSFVALSAYAWLLKHAEPAKVATYTYVNPVIAVFLGWLILSETITPTMLLAVSIIVLAVILITTHKSKRKPAAGNYYEEQHPAAPSSELGSRVP